MTQEALKLALEALEFYYDMHEEEADAKAITAIKEVLAQSEQALCDLAEDGVCETLDCPNHPLEEKNT